MPRDPIVEEVRAIRDAYAKQFDYDLEAIYRDLKKQEAKSGRQFMSLQPKRIRPAMQKDPATEVVPDLTTPS